MEIIDCVSFKLLLYVSDIVDICVSTQIDLDLELVLLVPSSPLLMDAPYLIVVLRGANT